LLLFIIIQNGLAYATVIEERLLNQSTQNIYSHFLSENEMDNASFFGNASLLHYFSKKMGKEDMMSLHE